MRLRYLLPFMIFFSFVIMIFSGVVILSNSGTPLQEWHFIGLSGPDYVKLNTNFLAIFTTSSFILWVIHWNAFVDYLVTRNMDPVLFRKRLYVTLIVTLIFFISSLEKIPTFGLFSTDDEPTNSVPEVVIEPNIEKEEEIVEEEAIEEIPKEAPKKEEKRVEKAPPKEVDELGMESLKEASKSQGFNLKKAISFLKIKGLSNVDEDMKISTSAKKLEVSSKKLIKMFKNHEKIMPD